MLELIVGFTLLGSIVATLLAAPKNQKKPEKSDSIKALEAILRVAVLHNSFNEDDRQKINRALESLK